MDTAFSFIRANGRSSVINGKTALVTGAGRGLGFFLSKTFLEQGYIVIALNKTGSPEFVKLAAGHKNRTFEFITDVSDESSVIKAAEEFNKNKGRIDIIVNNAGVHPEPAAHEWKPEPLLDNVGVSIVIKNFYVNTIGPLLVVKHFLPFLKTGEKKMIVNISSEAGCISQCFRKDEFGYCMSKAALNIQSKILQNRLSGYGIKVISVHPGWLKTEMGGQGATDDPAEAAKKIAALANRKWDIDDPIYMDSSGNPLPW